MAALLLSLLLSASLLPATAQAQALPFCGGAAQPRSPSDLEHVAGDMTLEHSAQQPANIITCAQGYLLAKCGDFDTANKVFDKCIAAGYVGAMIWKGLLYENGNGVPQDLTKAAALFKRAAESGDSGYATLGKVHYASALYEGKGVPRNQVAARDLFKQAAAEGSDEAREFLQTGYHTAGRDQTGAGVGIPTKPVRGLRLERVELTPEAPASPWPLLLLALVFGAGLLHQRTRSAGGSLFSLLMRRT